MVRALVLLSVLAAASSFAAAARADGEIQNFNQAFEVLNFGPGSTAELETFLAQVDGFIKSSGARTVLDSPGGVQLLHNRLRVNNFLAVQQGLSRCASDPESKRNLKSRVLDAGKNNSYASVGCDTLLAPFPEVNALADSVSKITDRLLTTDLAARVLDQSIENIFVASFDLHSIQNQPIAQPELFDQICPEGTGNPSCSPALKEHLEIIYQDLARARFSPGVPSPLAKVDRKEALEAVTGELQKIKELREQIGKGDEFDNIEALGDFIGANPVPLGQVLAQSPEFTPLACRLIQEVEQTDHNRVRRDKIVVVGGGVIGGTLLVTGALSWAGALILEGTAAATLSTIGAVTAGSVAAVTLAGAGYEGAKAFQARQDSIAVERAFLTGNGDSQSSAERLAFLNEYKQARLSAVISLGFSALDLGALKALSSVGKIKSLTAVFKEIGADSKITSSLLKLKAVVGSKRVIELIEHLGEMGKEARQTFLSQLKNLNKEQLLELARGSWQSLKTSNRIFWQEVRATRGLRFVLKARDTTQSRSFLKNSSEWVFHPLATAFDQSTQVTLPVALLGYEILFNTPVEATERMFKSKTFMKAEGVKDRVPGGDYIWFLLQTGTIDSNAAARAILRHDELLAKWKEDGDDVKSQLPRIAEFRKLGLLNGEEATVLGAMARETFSTCLDQYKSSGGAVGFQALLEQSISDRIGQDAHFSQRSGADRELLATLYWPLLKIDGKSDVTLSYDKLKIASHLVPDKRLGSFARPDAKLFAEPLEFNSDADGKPLHLSSEWDRWEAFLSDPRFAMLAGSWKEGKLTDAEAMSAFQSSVEGLNQIFEERSAGQALDWGNPLLGAQKAQLEELISEKKLNEAQSQACYKKIGVFWADFYFEQARSLATGKIPDGAAESEAASQYQKLAESCN